MHIVLYKSFPKAAFLSGAMCALLAQSVLAGPVLLRNAESPVVVRSFLDGAGPSHIFARGRTLIVLDPNEGILRRYMLEPADGIISSFTACSMPRNFSPRYVQFYGQGVRVLGEEMHPTTIASNAHLPVLDVPDSKLADLVGYAVGERPSTCGDVKEQSTTVPIETSTAANGFLVSPEMGMPFSKANAVLVQPDPEAELFSVHPIGTVDGIGPAFITRELIRGDEYAVNVAVGITIFHGRQPISIRLNEHRVGADGEIEGMKKRGFEYAAVAGHSLYILSTVCQAGFCIDRYDLSALPSDKSAGNDWAASIDLVSDSQTDQPEDGPVSDVDRHEHSSAAPTSPSVSNWNQHLLSAVASYAFVKWTYPPSFRIVPCKNAASDNCRVLLHDGNLVDIANASSTDTKIEQVGDEHDNAQWIGPRHLVYDTSIAPAMPTAEVGVPYSFGGDQTVLEFTQRVASGDSRPIGHIRDYLNGVDDNHYPLGIDCSRFVGHIFGETLDTASWITSPPPNVRPVPDLQSARSGDLIVKKGHIVIFSRRIVTGANRAVEVFEAGSRCGRVCRSVYDPDFFNRWRILRIREMKGAEFSALTNPFWSELDHSSNN